jgi:hypothetical protein
VSEEAAKFVSLIAIIGGSDMSIISHDKMVLSQLVLLVGNHWTKAIFGNLGKSGCSQELLIFLIL